MSTMRDECVALEAAHLAISSAGRSLTFGEIAEQAIAKVDEWEARGDLGLLHGTWTTDPEEVYGGRRT